MRNFPKKPQTKIELNSINKEGDESSDEGKDDEEEMNSSHQRDESRSTKQLMSPPLRCEMSLFMFITYSNGQSPQKKEKKTLRCYHIFNWAVSYGQGL